MQSLVCSQPLAIVGCRRLQMNGCYHLGVRTSLRKHGVPSDLHKLSCRALQEGEQPTLQEKEQPAPEKEDPESVTKKWGLEAGLWKAMTSKDGESGGGAVKAKDLLAKYGSAYLVTSISFALVSFTICYALVNAGVDVRSLLANIGLQVGDTGERVGTVAIAYAAHKALSPVRFPPTVALTPVVANILGKKDEQDTQDTQDEANPDQQ